MFGGKMIARRAGEGTRNSFVGSFDRVLGLGFGAVKGLLFASVGFLFVTLVYDTIYGHEAERPAWLDEAKTYTLLSASSRALVDFVNERRNGDAPSKRT
jgi:membrane protein required for colicin V production